MCHESKTITISAQATKTNITERTIKVVAKLLRCQVICILFAEQFLFGNLPEQDKVILKQHSHYV